VSSFVAQSVKMTDCQSNDQRLISAKTYISHLWFHDDRPAKIALNG